MLNNQWKFSAFKCQTVRYRFHFLLFQIKLCNESLLIITRILSAQQLRIIIWCRENDKHWHIYKKDVYHRQPSTKLFLQTVTHHFNRLWHTSSASYVAPHNFHRQWHKTPNKECVNVCMCQCLWVSLPDLLFLGSFNDSEQTKITWG